MVVAAGMYFCFTDNNRVALTKHRFCLNTLLLELSQMRKLLTKSRDNTNPFSLF